MLIIVKILSRTPFFILYLISDFLFILAYYILKYRRDIVYSNLKHAFPEKSKQERKKIEKKFYRHLCDVVVESLKLLTPKELEKRLIIQESTLLKNLDDSGKDAIFISGHYGNWEWFQVNHLIKKASSHCIYQKISHDSFNKIIKYLREMRGNILIERKEILKKMIANKKKQVQSWYGFVADQSPIKEHPYWITFVNRETPAYSEIEKIAKKLNTDVFLILIKKIKRGHYYLHLEPIAINPNQYEEYEITSTFFKKLEEQIRLEPEYYLWSHNRWKHKKDNPTKAHERSEK